MKTDTAEFFIATILWFFVDIVVLTGVGILTTAAVALGYAVILVILYTIVWLAVP